MNLRRGLRAIALAAAASPLVLGAPGIAHAATSDWLRPDAGGPPLFDVANMTPGAHGSRDLAVTNPAHRPVTVAVRVGGLRDDDNGCTGPERAAGDDTCGPGGGELRRELRLTLTDAGTGRAVHSGPVSAWARADVVDRVPVGARAARTYRLAYELPAATGNDVQSDRVSFDLRVRLDGATGGGDPVREETLPALPALPTTGRPTGPLLAAAVALIGAGAAAVALVRPRRPRTAR